MLGILIKKKKRVRPSSPSQEAQPKGLEGKWTITKQDDPCCNKGMRKVLKNIQEEALGATPGPGEGEGLSGQATKVK